MLFRSLLGTREIPDSVLYGVQTLRGIENFEISKFHLKDYPLFIKGLAITKWGAAVANHELGLISDEQFNAIVQACKELIEGQHHEQFPVDMIQSNNSYINIIQYVHKSKQWIFVVVTINLHSFKLIVNF